MGLGKYVSDKVFGSKNIREIKKLQPLVQQINRLEPSVRALSDTDLKGKTKDFKQYLAQEVEKKLRVNSIKIPIIFAIHFIWYMVPP